MATAEWVFFLDVDNTLIDNDAVKADLDRAIATEFGSIVQQQFWALYDAVRRDLDRVDFPEVLRRLRAGAEPAAVAERLTALVNAIPFERYRYPGALAALAHLTTLGTPVILSDGDPVFQPEKIRRAGIADAVHGRVVITTHKETELAGVLERFPADYYVMIDDKPSILAAIGQRYPRQFRTILVTQGHYGHDSTAGAPRPNVTIAHIAELKTLSLAQLGGPGQ